MAIREEVTGRVRREKVRAVEVCFASPEDLVIHKIIAGRPRDLEDVRRILIKIRDMNAECIRHWLELFQQGTGESFLDRFQELWEETP